MSSSFPVTASKSVLGISIECRHCSVSARIWLNAFARSSLPLFHGKTTKIPIRKAAAQHMWRIKHSRQSPRLKLSRVILISPYAMIHPPPWLTPPPLPDCPTLTRKNVPFGELRPTLRAMNRVWERLAQFVWPYDNRRLLQDLFEPFVRVQVHPSRASPTPGPHGSVVLDRDPQRGVAVAELMLRGQDSILQGYDAVLLLMEQLQKGRAVGWCSIHPCSFFGARHLTDVAFDFVRIRLWTGPPCPTGFPPTSFSANGLTGLTDILFHCDDG